jgi:hypothetical protein
MRKARLDRIRLSEQASLARTHFQRRARPRHQIFKGLQRCRPFPFAGIHKRPSAIPRVARTEDEPKIYGVTFAFCRAVSLGGAVALRRASIPSSWSTFSPKAPK